MIHGLKPTFAVVLIVVGLMWDAVALAVAFVRGNGTAVAIV